MTDLLGTIPSPSSGSIHIGPLQLRAYGLFIALGALTAIKITATRWERRGGDGGLVSSFCLFAVPAGLIGARLYHLATDWNTYSGNRWEMLAIWKGGLGIWGGIALGTAVGAFVVHREGVSALTMMNMAAPGLAVAQAIGRVGNYFNQELYGRPTSMPWGLRIDDDQCLVGYDCATEAFHPTFLYELLWCLLVALVVVFVFERSLRRGRVKPGQTFALYVLLYTVGRSYFEHLRIDPASEVLGLRVNEVVAPVVGLLALVAFVLLGRRSVDPDPTPEQPIPAGAAGARVVDATSDDDESAGATAVRTEEDGVEARPGAGGPAEP